MEQNEKYCEERHKLITPSGKEVEILSEQEYFKEMTSGSRVSQPMPHDYNNWTYFLMGYKNKELYDSLTEDDKIFIMNSRFELYINLYTKKVAEKPKPPLSRIIREGTSGTCPKCHSTEIKRFIFFGRSIGCIQPECENYHKNLKFST